MELGSFARSHAAYLMMTAGLLSGCNLYFGDSLDDKDDPCLYGGAQAPEVGAVAPLRDPFTGQCEFFGGGGGDCYSECGPPCLDSSSGGGALPSWGYCDSFCSGLSEASCLSTQGCRGAYIDNGAGPQGSGEMTVSSVYYECWATDQSGPIQGGACALLDAWECSRHDDCVATHQNGCFGATDLNGGEMGPGQTGFGCGVGPFLQCDEEPDEDPVDVGRCGEEVWCNLMPPDCPPAAVPGVADGCWTGFCIPEEECAQQQDCQALDEPTCVSRSDCMPLYEGIDCTCDGEACKCADWAYASCRIAFQPNLIEAEDDSLVSRQGNWGVFVGGVLHDGAGLEAATANAYLSFLIHGTTLTVHHGVGPNRHDFVVHVDGEPAAWVDTNAPEFGFQVATMIATGLDPGPHMVTLECLSAICAIDYFTAE